MRNLLLTTALSAAALFACLTTAPAARAQKRQDKCEQSFTPVRNWEVIGSEYVYFDYVLCPPGLSPPKPLVHVWLTTRGDGFAVEKWSEARDGADVVTVFRGTKKAFTVYRDLSAVPLALFKAERRAAVPAETAKQPFLVEPPNLVPFENLKPESAERVRKVFESADVLIRQAEKKNALLAVTEKVGVVVNSLAEPLKFEQ